jgi:ribosome recycling factor
MKANRLTQGQSYQLVRWVEGRAEEAKTRSFAEMAREASDVLGFTVTEPNVRSTAKTLGIERPTRASLKSEMDGDPTPIEALALAILDMAEKLGISPFNTNDLVALAHPPIGPSGELPL